MRFASAVHSAACAGGATNRTTVMNTLSERQAALRCCALVGSKPASERNVAISCALTAAGRRVESTTSRIRFAICFWAPSTVTPKLAFEALPPESVATHSTVVSPIANRLPEDGVQTRVGAGSRSSVAVAV